jgi:hypothetical protein
MENVQVNLSMSKPFHDMLQKIAGSRTVEEWILENVSSAVESMQEASEDPRMQGSGYGGVVLAQSGKKLMALAIGGKKKKKPFLTDEEIDDLMDRFYACWQRLLGPAMPPPQAVGEGKVIRFPRRAGSESQKGA